MTKYDYVCKNCGYKQDFNHNMKIGPAKKHKCPKCNGVMIRDFSSSATIIPSYFNEPGNKIKYDKSPSRRKHFF